MERLTRSLSCPGYPVVPRIDDGETRPFWSVKIPTYNRTEYLKLALESVLSQARGPDEMDIEVVDNCSTDSDAEAIVRRSGAGRVSFYRQPGRVSMSENWNTCIARARGRWVHILHDDDTVLPGFYEAYARFIEEHSEVVAVFCRAISIDRTGEWMAIMPSPPNRTASGVLRDAMGALVTKNFICAPTMVVARDVYEKVRGFSEPFRQCPDWEMWMRIASTGPLGYLHRPYLLYRVHAGSGTGGFGRAASDFDEIVRAIEIGVERLPREQRRDVRRAALRNCAEQSNTARALLQAEGDHRAALEHAVWAFRLHPSSRNVLRIVKSALLVVRWGGKRRR